MPFWSRREPVDPGRLSGHRDPVAGTSPEATRALLRYWRAIRPGSGAIRRSRLAAIRRAGGAAD
jgi:hypothetical protein